MKKLISVILIAFVFIFGPNTAFKAAEVKDVTKASNNLNVGVQDDGEFDPLAPTDPIDPTAPGTEDPIDPVDPTDPGIDEPSNPTDPIDPEEPIDPTNPGIEEPTDPIDPIDPTQPEDPVDPTTPVDTPKPTPTEEAPIVHAADDTYEEETYYYVAPTRTLPNTGENIAQLLATSGGLLGLGSLTFKARKYFKRKH